MDLWPVRYEHARETPAQPGQRRLPGHLGLAFRLHVQAALYHSVPFSEVLSMMRFIGPYVGLQAAADALERLGEFGVELRVDIPSPASEVDAGDSSGAHDPRLPHVEGFDTTDGWLSTSSPPGSAGRGRCQV